MRPGVRSAAFALAAGLALALSGPTAAQDAASDEVTYVRARRLYTGLGMYPNGVLAIRKGKLEGVYRAERIQLGPGVKVREVEVIAPGFVLTELVDGRGIEESLGARYRVIDGFDPYAGGHTLLAQGITTAFLHPGLGRLATGEGAVIKLGGPAAGRVLRQRAELCLDAGAGALGPPPRVKIPFPSSSDVPIEPATPQRPTGRSGIVPELAAKLRAALAYASAREGKSGERPERDLDLEVLAAAALDGRLRVEANRVGELRALLGLLQELGIEPTLSGGVESYRVLEELSGLGARLIYRLPFGTANAGDRGEGLGGLDPRWSTPRKLAAAGVPFAFAPPAAGGAADLRLAAALSVRGGLSESAALAAITRQAANLLGVGDRVGYLTAGLDADFVVLSGDPLATATQVRETWIAGEQVYDASAPLEGETRSRALVVRAGKIVTAAGPVLLDGAVLVIDGQIAAVGSSVPVPPGARVIDAGPEGVVTPGFVDAYGHLGLQGQSGAELNKARLGDLLAADRPSTLRVARAGVTTVVVGPRGITREGTRLGALKTLGSEDLGLDLRRGFLLKEVVATALDLTREDPQAPPKVLLGKLAGAKRQVQAWAKYREALERWTKEQAQKLAKAKEELVKKRRARQVKEAPQAEDKSEDKAGEKGDKPEDKAGEKGDKPEEAPKKKFDPVSGTWEFTLSGGPLPEPREGGQMLLALGSDGKTITGVARAPGGQGEDAPISGKLEGKEVELDLEVDSPFGKPKIKGTLDGEDHMTGRLLLGPLTLNVDATRTERSVPEIKIKFKRGKSKDGRPSPPEVPPVEDGLRLALEGRAPLIVAVKHPRVALNVLEVAKEAGLRVVFLDFPDLDLVLSELRAAGAGVLLSPESGPAEGARRLSRAAQLAEAGIPFGFTSRTGDAAEWLPLRVLGAVSRGLDPGRALAGLTIDSARLLGIADRVGSLEVGKDGDLLIFSGPPLEATSRLERVFVRGREVPAEGEE